MNPLAIIFTIFGEIFRLIGQIVALSVPLILLWLFIAMFIPGLDWFDHAYNVALYLFVYPAGVMFNFFIDLDKTILAMEWGENPIRIFALLLAHASCLFLTFALPLGYWLVWSAMTFVFVTMGVSLPEPSPHMTNLGHLIMGRTTIDETYAAEVLANEIAAAQKK